MSTQRVRLSIALSLASLTGLSACSSGVEREIVMSRWLKKDTTLAFTLHRYGWKGEGARLSTEPRTSEMQWSRAELYAVDVVQTDSGRYFTGLRRLLIIHHAVPCPDLMFSPEDSLVIFSYLDRDQAKPRTCYEGGEGPGAPNPARRLMAGVPRDSSYGEIAGSLDTNALLSALAGDNARLSDVPVLSSNGLLCLEGNKPCVIPYD